jgi:hypothetical protein
LILSGAFGNDGQNPFIGQMEKSEHRFVIKFLFLKRLSASTIDRELSTVIGPTAYFLVEVKNRRTRFTEGNLTWSDQLRTGRPRHTLGTDLSHFLREFPFAKARQLAQHFDESMHTIKVILEDELGLRNLVR